MYIIVMDAIYHINDTRACSDFKGITFSGYKLGEVLNTLVKSMTDAKIEDACYWSAELICAGHLKELWNVIITYYSKHINITNPRLAIYLEMRFDHFVQLLTNECMSTEILLRNNDTLRGMMCEIMCVLCESTHGHVLTDIKVSTEEFDCLIIKDKLRAPTVTYLDGIFLEDDPKDLYIAVNELCFQLSPDGIGGLYSACYWVEWIMKYTKYCKTKNKKCQCVRRSYVHVESIHQMDTVWIIWDALIQYSAKKGKDLLDKIILSLHKLYCVRYTGISVYIKRKYIIYCAITYLFFPETINNPMLSERVKKMIPSATSNICIIYQQIKKNEHSPKTDYLFTDISKTKKIEDSINKLRILNSVLPTATPDPSDI